MERESLRIECTGARTLPFESLHVIQGDLKDLSEEDYQKFRAELLEHGFSEPIGVWWDHEHDAWCILSGTQRFRTLSAMKSEGIHIPEIPVSVIEAPDLKTAKRKILALASHYGVVSEQGLYEFLSGIDVDVPSAIANLKLPEVDLQKWFQNYFDDSPQGSEDEIPEPQKEPISKLGDLYELGNHRVLCGDSTKRDDVDRLMDGQKGDLLLTDPPYGVSYIEKNAAVHGGKVLNNIGKQITNDSGSVEEMAELWGHLFSHADHFTDQSSYYVFSPQGGELMMMMMMMQAIYQSKWQLKHSLIWQKQNFVFGRCDYHYQHEPVLYGWKKKGTHNWYADRSQSSLLQFDKPHKSDLHPTTKPVDILEYLLGNSTKIQDLVVDLFLGSGSTLIACEKTNRKCFGCEIDPHYVDVIVSRWCKFTGQTKVKKNGQEIIWDTI